MSSFTEVYMVDCTEMVVCMEVKSKEAVPREFGVDWTRKDL